MGTVTWSGPMRAGTQREGASQNLGNVVLMQSAVLTFDATLVQNATFFLPSSSQLIDVFADTRIVFDSATSATLSFGITAGGTEYGGSLDVKTAGRKRPTLTVAQAVAYGSIAANTSLIATVTSVGQPTTGSLQVTILYRQV